MIRKIGIPVLLLAALVVGCGARLPSPETSQKIIKKHFKKYGKRHKETDFGRHKMERVEVAQTEELQRDWAQAEAYAYLKEGPVYRVRVTLRKKAFGWRYVSWENLGAR